MKKEKETYTEGGTNLVFKDQREFFDTFYRIRDTFQVEFAKSHYDKKSIKICYQNLQALIMLTTAQISSITNLDEIKTKESSIAKLINERKYEMALKQLRSLHDELSIYWSKVEITPKVNEEEININAEWWKKETNAGFREMKKAFFDSFMIPQD